MMIIATLSKVCQVCQVCDDDYRDTEYAMSGMSVA